MARQSKVTQPTEGQIQLFRLPEVPEPYKKAVEVLHSKPRAPMSLMHRKLLNAWAFYDWANSALITTVITAVYPIYFKNVAASGLDPADSSFKHSLATVIALTIVAVIAPILGPVTHNAGQSRNPRTAL